VLCLFLPDEVFCTPDGTVALLTGTPRWAILLRCALQSVRSIFFSLVRPIGSVESFQFSEKVWNVLPFLDDTISVLFFMRKFSKN
jgi:hypothetical protein